MILTTVIGLYLSRVLASAEYRLDASVTSVDDYSTGIPSTPGTADLSSYNQGTFWNSRGATTYILANDQSAQPLGIAVRGFDRMDNVSDYYLTRTFDIAPASPATFWHHPTAFGNNEHDWFVAGATDGSVQGAAYVFEGNQAHWSQQQKLGYWPKASCDTGSITFGSNLALDAADWHTLVVTAEDCGAPTDATGALFVYESAPKGDKWSQQAMLVGGTSSRSAADSLGGSGVAIYDDTIAAVGTRDSGVHMGVEVFTRSEGPAGAWSNTQTLWHGAAFSDATAIATSVSAAEDTIAIGFSGYTIDAALNAGEVHVYALGRAPGPKASPARYSLLQVLRAADAQDGRYFGSEVTFDGANMLLVTGDGDASDNKPSNYIYARKGNQWSAQQKLEPSADWSTSTVSPKVSWRDSQLVVTGTGLPFTTYVTDGMWGCVLVTLEDEFGDGWMGANLVVDTPNGESDHFTNNNYNANPTMFRYCPSESSNEGKYTFRVKDAPMYEYFWEILWTVEVEATGEVFVGRHDSRFDFVFRNGVFMPGKMDAAYGNATCGNCMPPKVPPKRMLKGESHETASPTVTPPPTLDTTDEWSTFAVPASPGQPVWFREDYRGTNYYFSDIDGKRVYSSGTSCSDEADLNGDVLSCSQVFPDGDYVLRVGGALQSETTLTAGTVWRFCYISGTASTALYFTIKDGECTPTAVWSADDIVGALNYYGVLNFDILFNGLNVQELNARDIKALEHAVSEVLGVALVEDSSSFSLTGSVVSVKCLVNMNALGYDIKQAGQQNAAMTLINKEFYSANGAKLYSLLVSNEYGSTAFQGSSSIEITNVEQRGQVLSSSISDIAQQGQFGGLTQHQNSPHTTANNVELVNEASMGFSVLGYILVGCTVLFLAIYVGVKSRVSGTSETFKPVKNADKLDNVEAPKPVSNKSQISLADMKKLVADEDESLNKAMQVGK